MSTRARQTIGTRRIDLFFHLLPLAGGSHAFAELIRVGVLAARAEFASGTPTPTLPRKGGREVQAQPSRALKFSINYRVDYEMASRRDAR